LPKLRLLKNPLKSGNLQIAKRGYYWAEVTEQNGIVVSVLIKLNKTGKWAAFSPERDRGYGIGEHLNLLDALNELVVYFRDPVAYIRDHSPLK